MLMNYMVRLPHSAVILSYYNFCVGTVMCIVCVKPERRQLLCMLSKEV